MALEMRGERRAFFFCMHSARCPGPAALSRLLEEIQEAGLSEGGGAPAALISLRPQLGATYMVDYFATAEAAEALREMQRALTPAGPLPEQASFYRWADHRFVAADCPPDVVDACREAIGMALGCHEHAT